jgi:translation initiation factor IF-1
MSDEKIVRKGEVLDSMRDARFKVELKETDRELMCHISGKIRQNNIEILPGDLVRVEISPYDLEKGRIVRRLDNDEYSYEEEFEEREEEDV